ncbi:MAG: signal peptidase I [Alphaproteobacteria bacterium]
MSSEADTKAKEGKGGVGEILRLVVTVTALFLFFRVILFQPFNIPSGSMIPTLRIGDYLFVSKFSYGWSKYSIPFSPSLFNGRIFGSEPKRGDVIVFRHPRHKDTDFIKRLIGLPGDKIQVTNGVLYINGKAVKLERIEDFDGAPGTCNGRGDARTKVARYIETLPNGVKHEILDCSPDSEGDNTREYVVPPGFYFMMGDNRDNSTDSRFPGLGIVPRENLIGRARIMYMSIDTDPSETSSILPFSIRWDRIFNIIR